MQIEKKKEMRFLQEYYKSGVVAFQRIPSGCADVHVSCCWCARFDRLVKIVNSRFLLSEVE